MPQDVGYLSQLKGREFFTHIVSLKCSEVLHMTRRHGCKAQFDVNKSDEHRFKMDYLVGSAKGFWKEDQLQKCRMVFEDDSQDEVQVKRLCLSPRV